MRILRSVLAIAAGLFVLSLVAEAIEFAIVAAMYGSVTDDQTVYFGVRNRPGVLMAKLVYNTGAALLAGYTAASYFIRTAGAGPTRRSSSAR